MAKKSKVIMSKFIEKMLENESKKPNLERKGELKGPIKKIIENIRKAKKEHEKKRILDDYYNKHQSQDEKANLSKSTKLGYYSSENEEDILHRK